MSFSKWMAQVRVDSLTRGCNQTQFNLLFGKFDQLFFNHAWWWWWLEVTTFFAYLAKEEIEWITNQEALKKSIPHKWQNEIPPSTSPKWNTICTKKFPFSSRSSIRLWRLMSGMEKSRLRLTKVAPTAARGWHNRWNIGSSTVHSLNKGGSMLLISFGNSWPKEGTLAHENPFLWCNASFVQDIETVQPHLVFLRTVLLWIIWSQHNDIVFNALQWPTEETHQVIWEALQGYSRIKWQRTLADLEKAPDVAYQDVLNKFDSTLGGGVTGSNLVVTWDWTPHGPYFLNPP